MTRLPGFRHCAPMPHELLAFAHSLADAARAETLLRWHSGCAVEGKSGTADFDPVTEADR